MAAEPDVWTDGSLVEDKVSGASSAGAGCFTYRCSRLWADWRWGHLDEDVGEDAVVSACRGFCSVPGPLQSVQRAEFLSVILASLDPMVWSVGVAPKRRRVVLAVRDRAFLPGPAGVLGGEWGVAAATPITCHDIELWPYSVSMLVKWVTFLATCTGLRVGSILGLVVFLLWRCSFCMSCGLVRGWIWRRLFPGTPGQVAQFQCRLFLSLIFGDLAGILVRYFVLLLVCLAVFVGSSPVTLVPVTVGFGTLGG